MPHSIGTFEGKEIYAAAGRYGPYLKYDGSNITLDKNIDISKITLEQAIDYIKNKETKNVIKGFAEDASIKVMNGRYGAYLTDGNNNYKIPKDMIAANLTFEDCKKIIQETSPTTKKRTIRRKK